MVEIKKNLVNESKYNIKCPYEMTPEYITVHNTANDAPAKNEIAYMIGNDKKVSFHLAVDDIEAVQGIEFNRNSWNAGDGADGDGNRKSIAIEICYSKSGGDRFIQAEKNAAELIASMLKERDWGIDRVKKHQDFNGKYCPHRTLDMGWDRFLDMIKTYLNDDTATKEQDSTNTPVATKQTVTLPASANSWAIYDMNVQPVKKNAKGYLKPSKFGGLTYEILGWTMKDVAIIKTRDFGQVQIYVAPSTGAIINGTQTPQPAPEPVVEYYPAFSNISIVDGLKSIGVDSSMTNRKKIAAANGINNYVGEVNQNVQLCNLAKMGKLKKY